MTAGGEPAAAPAAERQEADELRDLAERVHEAKLVTLGRLIAGVAHELNTPMGALNSNHDTLKRALGRLQAILADEVVEPDELVEVRRIVAALAGVLRVNDMAIERMRALLESLRSFGGPDRARLEQVDVAELVDAALALLRHETSGRIEVRTRYQAPPIHCYPEQLGQALMNLLLNAVQATPGGSIEVSTAPEGDGIAVCVTDTGVGIAPEHMERIFEPGFTTKGRRVGMGLGLLITHQIVQRHGGRLTVTSTLGEGSAFTLHLPSRPPHEEADGAATP